jgi:hypothetical protein
MITNGALCKNRIDVRGFIGRTYNIHHRIIAHHRLFIIRFRCLGARDKPDYHTLQTYGTPVSGSPLFPSVGLASRLW